MKAPAVSVQRGILWMVSHFACSRGCLGHHIKQSEMGEAKRPVQLTSAWQHHFSQHLSAGDDGSN